tara:strand:- start:791 stop:1123 length:333 start_codon:yes stop_codon:yes gene_type:complete
MSATPPHDDNEKWYSIYLIINLTFEEEEEKITLKKTTNDDFVTTNHNEFFISKLLTRLFPAYYFLGVKKNNGRRRVFEYDKRFSVIRSRQRLDGGAAFEINDGRRIRWVG